jgi:hypothetical protein
MDDGEAELNAVLAATYSVSACLHSCLVPATDSATSFGWDLTILEPESDGLMEVCSGDPLRVHTDDEFDAVVNAGLNLMHRVSESVEKPELLPADLRLKLKDLVQACIVAGLIDIN